jgi:AcrR family transcriptional regulator
MDIEERQRILDVASRRFMETGISKVTLDEISSELGMSKKTMYKFFPSKDDLLRTIVHAMMKRVQGHVEEIVRSDKPFLQKIPEFLEFFGRQMSLLSKQFIVDLQRFAPDLWKEMERFRRERILTNVRLMFDQAKREGVFRKDLNVDLFVLVFLNSVQNIINPQTLSQQSFSTEEAFQQILTIIFEGAVTDEARQHLHLFDQSQPSLIHDR